MKAGLYARVSTDEQTVEQQLQDLRRVAAQRGYEAIEYKDEGLSGALHEKERPALQRMMNDARLGKVKVVLCWDVSRLGRSVWIVLDLVERLHSYGVMFMTLRDNIDTTTPQGEFQFHVFAALAQLNRKMISQNTKAKLKLLKNKGIKLGRPVIHVNPETVRLRAAAGDLSLRQLADLFKIGKSSVARILKEVSQKRVSKNGLLHHSTKR